MPPLNKGQLATAISKAMTFLSLASVAQLYSSAVEDSVWLHVGMNPNRPPTRRLKPESEPEGQQGTEVSRNKSLPEIYGHPVEEAARRRDGTRVEGHHQPLLPPGPQGDPKVLGAS